MSIKLGNGIPASVVETLNSGNLQRSRTVIFMISTDPQNYPHIALLSPFQVIIDDNHTLYFSVYKKSSTHDYLVKNKKFTLIIQDVPALLYLKCRIIPTEIGQDQPDDTHHFFKAESMEVLRDVSERAPLISEILFQTEQIVGDYTQEFLKLSEYIKRSRNQK
ncbi:MAG: hypothetical protein ACYCT2_06805 [Thermoplasmataceae archaeon]